MRFLYASPRLRRLGPAILAATVLLISTTPLLEAVGTDDYVLVQKGVFQTGSGTVRLDSFEIASHPVTNLQYAEFVKAAGHPAPPYWENGVAPRGMEQWPVTFVNGSDANAYCRWRSKVEGRIYRLPTAAEFEYAARGGLEGKRYPWGDEEPIGRANFDPDANRSFGDWRKWMKPVKSYPANGYGLYDMAGNVWQMILAEGQGRTPIRGGSWARTATRLQSASSNSVPNEMRHPDIGFRPVRAPAGSSHFSVVRRAVLAMPGADGTVYVGWRMLESDEARTGYHVYRSLRPDAAGERLTSAPIADSTNFVDLEAPKASRIYYRVRPVDSAGLEGAPSEWADVNAGAAVSHVVTTFRPSGKGPYSVNFGDLDGDGILDGLVRSGNGLTEGSPDPGIPAELEAFSSSGRQLWRRPLARHGLCGGIATNLPFNVYDLDGDGKAEVIARVQDGEQMYLAVLDGLTGNIVRKTRWREMASDRHRAHLAIAYLDGRTPAIVTQTGLYVNEIFDAYSSDLTNLWTFRSFGETSGSGCHYIAVADVDDDGRDEIFDGTTVINPDGRMRWSIYRGHPDIVIIKRILPSTKDRQVFFAVETNMHAGAYVVDAKSGNTIWKHNSEEDMAWNHAHLGWVADIWKASPGLEILTNRDGHDTNRRVLFSSAGAVLADPLEGDWRPVNWTGQETRDLMSKDAKQLGRFDGQRVQGSERPGPATMARCSCPLSADLIGDFRDEIVCWGTLKGGVPAIQVLSNFTPVQRKEPARMEDREYRLWVARNRGGAHGYPTYFEWQPQQ